jgi:hypothetical protein
MLRPECQCAVNESLGMGEADCSCLRNFDRPYCRRRGGHLACQLGGLWNIAAKTSLCHLTALHAALSEFRSLSNPSLDTTTYAHSNVPAARVFCA